MTKSVAVSAPTVKAPAVTALPTMRFRKLAMLIPTDGELVERPGPGQAASAFRIWAAGENRCDDGSIFFTEESATALMEEQGDRNRLYPFDFDHLSLLSDRPATSGRAAGWHNLEIRKDAQGASELWAINIQWCEDTKAGFEAQPPLWRYFSPAFFTDKDAKVTGYTNCAVCINPLTHDLPSLATLRVKAVSAAKTSGDCSPMDKKAYMAALAVLASSESSEDEKKEAAAALAADKADDAPPADDKESDGDESDKEKPKAEAEGDAPEEDKKDEKKEEAARAATVKLAKENMSLQARVDAIEIASLLASRKDLSPTVRSWAATQSLATVKSFVATTAIEVKREKSPTQGEASGSSFVAPAMGTHAVDKVFGILPPNKNTTLGLSAVDPETGRRTLSIMSPTEARQLAAKKGAV